MRDSPIPRIFGTQIGLRAPELVDQIKAAMRAGAFVFFERDSQIAGIRVQESVYYVREGHHRMVAALSTVRPLIPPTS